MITDRQVTVSMTNTEWLALLGSTSKVINTICSDSFEKLNDFQKFDLTTEDKDIFFELSREMYYRYKINSTIVRREESCKKARLRLVKPL